MTEDASAIFVARAKRRGHSFALSASFSASLIRMAPAEQLRQIDWLIAQLSNKRDEIVSDSVARDRSYDPNSGKAEPDMNTNASNSDR